MAKLKTYKFTDVEAMKGILLDLHKLGHGMSEMTEKEHYEACCQGIDDQLIIGIFKGADMVGGAMLTKECYRDPHAKGIGVYTTLMGIVPNAPEATARTLILAIKNHAISQGADWYTVNRCIGKREFSTSYHYTVRAN